MVDVRRCVVLRRQWKAEVLIAISAALQDGHLYSKFLLPSYVLWKLIISHSTDLPNELCRKTHMSCDCTIHWRKSIFCDEFGTKFVYELIVFEPLRLCRQHTQLYHGDRLRCWIHAVL